MKSIIKGGVTFIALGLLWFVATPGDQSSPDATLALLDAVKSYNSANDVNGILKIQSELSETDTQKLTAKLSANDADGNTAFLIAVYNNLPEDVIRGFVSAFERVKLDPIQDNFRLNNPFHMIKTDAMADLLLSLLGQYFQLGVKDPTYLSNADDNTPLFFARTATIAKKFQAAGMHVYDLANFQNKTPLMFVVSVPVSDYVKIQNVTLLPGATQGAVDQGSAQALERKRDEDQVRKALAENFIADAKEHSEKKVKIRGKEYQFFAVVDLDGNNIFHNLAKSDLAPAVIVSLINSIKNAYQEGYAKLLAASNNIKKTPKDLAQAKDLSALQPYDKDQWSNVINALAV